MQIIADARANPVVDALYQAVDASTPISATLSTGRTWSSTTTGGVTRIEAAKTVNPAESLYHELLHAQLKIEGYKQYTHVFWAHPLASSMHAILEPLDNELQHHRMYSRFVAAGFDGAKFYCDMDDSTLKDTRRDVRRFDGSTHPSVALLKWLAIIAPGGCGTDQERRQIRSFMRSQVGSATYGKLERIEQILKVWGESAETDPGSTLVEILQILGLFSGCWVGYSQNYPADGLVVP